LFRSKGGGRQELVVIGAGDDARDVGSVEAVAREVARLAAVDALLAVLAVGV
jgi:hypothetical protein